MTFIISCVVGNNAIQVSDRRLTKLDGSIFDDDSNKAVLFCGHVVFAYTGLAFVGHERTDTWLTNQLAKARTGLLPEAVQAIANKATEDFKKIRLGRSAKRTAFVGVGWVTVKDRTRPAPVIVTISNALTDEGSWRTEANDEFTFQINIGPDQRSCNLVCSGQSLSQARSKSLRRKISQCLNRGVGAESVARILVDEVLNLAQTNRAVGSNLMVTSLPVDCCISPHNPFLTDLSPNSTLTMPNNASFKYVSQDGQSVVQYAPNCANIGQVMTDMKLTRLNDSGSDATISMKVKFVGDDEV